MTVKVVSHFIPLKKHLKFKKMKKQNFIKSSIFLSLFILTSCIINAQFQQGLYIFKLAHNGLAMELDGGGVKAINACADYNVNCHKQIWEVKPVAGRPNVFTIRSMENGNYLTALSARIDVLPKHPATSIKMQQFTISTISDGKITVQADSVMDTRTTYIDKFYLSVEKRLINSSNQPVLFSNLNPSVNQVTTDLSNIHWTAFKVTNLTRQIINRPPPQPAAPRSVNKLEVDFKTGADNLEPKPFQHNLQIRIKVDGLSDYIFLYNANKDATWPNGSTRRVTIPLPADVLVENIKEIEVGRYSNEANLPRGVDMLQMDNWNLQKLTVNAVILNNGLIKRTLLMDEGGHGPNNNAANNPLFRFTYDNGNGSDNGIRLTRELRPRNPIGSTRASDAPTSNAKITAIFGTGGDNLEGGRGNNVNIKIKMRTGNKTYTINNINQYQNWANFTEHTVTKEILNSNTLDINDVYTVTFQHTGGGGLFADNWHVDKLYLSITKDGVTKVLVDVAGTPYHAFTGETRNKMITITN
jgi:hypothetical protein